MGNDQESVKNPGDPVSLDRAGVSTECADDKGAGNLVGVVVEVKDGIAEVRVGVDKCQGCGHSGTCALLLQGQSSYTLTAKAHGAVRQGDRVKVQFSGSVKVKTACLVYLCPSISTVLGGVLGAEWLSGVIGVSPSVGGLIAALLLLPLGLSPAYLANRRGHNLPVVSEILKED